MAASSSQSLSKSSSKSPAGTLIKSELQFTMDDMEMLSGNFTESPASPSEVGESSDEANDSLGSPTSSESPESPTVPPRRPSLSAIDRLRRRDMERIGELEDRLESAEGSLETAYSTITLGHARQTTLENANIRLRRDVDFYRDNLPACTECHLVVNTVIWANQAFYIPWCGHVICDNCLHRMSAARPQVQDPTCNICEYEVLNEGRYVSAVVRPRPSAVIPLIILD